MGKKTQLNSGDKIGSWTLEKKIGKGGNGYVWRVNEGGDEKKAIKILKKNKNTPLARFKDEIKVMKQFNSLKGLLTIYDYNISESKDDLSWFVMDLASPIKDMDFKFYDVIEGLREIAQVIVHLHSRGYSHRDIKPENILYFQNGFVLSDFGLVHYQDKEAVTKYVTGSVGPVWTIAPEMRRNPLEADGKKADIYSLAKTMWILLTKEDKGYEGQYPNDEKNSLKKYYPNLYLSPLEKLMKASTNENPDLRPNIFEFIEVLDKWLLEYSDFSKTNYQEWLDLHEKIFPVGIPKRVVWTDINCIVSVLNEIASVSALNHMFLPSFGGMDLEAAQLSDEQGKIELTAGFKLVIKPKKLIYEGFDENYSWNYFRIVTDEFEPCLSDTDTSDLNLYPEEVVLIDGEWYHASEAEFVYLNKPQASIDYQSRFYQGGDFVIFQKQSPYNLDNGTYDGRHARMSSRDFREYIERSIKNYGKF